MNPKMLFCLGVVAWTVPTGAALADVVYVNSGLAPVNAILATGVEAKYRISNTSHDLSLHPAAGASGSGFPTWNLGNNAFLSVRSYDVYFSHKVGEGFSLNVRNQAVSVTLKLPSQKNNSSGGGDDGDGGDGGGGGGGGGGAPANWYNAIRWDMFSTRPGAHTKFAYFTFSSPTLAIADGAFYNGDAKVEDGTSHLQQWIVSDGNLLEHDWTAFGRVQCFLDTLSNTDDEAIGYTVSMMAVDTPVAPAPGAAAVLGLAGLVGSRRRR